MMQITQQTVTGAAQLASSATSVATSLARPRTATSSTASSAATSSAASSSTTGSTSSDTSSGGSSTITADDFLTLLVAEMKNQDPTQPTDPSQYISQMVDVNSLQQLIGINQGITSLDTAAGATPSTSTSGS